jgi:Bacterial SH3 domain
MASVYLDRELNGNREPTGCYRISIDESRRLHRKRDHNEFVEHHKVEVRDAIEVKTKLLDKFKQNRIKKRKFQDLLTLSQSELDALKTMMDEHQYSSDFGGSFLVICAAIMIGFITLVNQPLVQRYKGEVDGSNLGYKFAYIRAEPNENSTPTGKIENGEEVLFTREKEGWSHIISDEGYEGWVINKAIKSE